jgi:hypothetical protein
MAPVADFTAPDGVTAPVSTKVGVALAVVAIKASDPPTRPKSFHEVAVGYVASKVVASIVTEPVGPVTTAVFAVLAGDSTPASTMLTL